MFLSDRDSHHPEFYIYDLEVDSVSRLLIPPIVHFPMANGPAFLPGGDEFIYQEENEPNFVHLISVSMDDQLPSDLLFAVDLIMDEETDLALSQVCRITGWESCSHHFKIRFLLFSFSFLTVCSLA